MAVLLAEHDFLAYARLDFLVHAGVGQAHHQAVGIGLAGNADFADEGFVVVGVVKAAHALNLVLVHLRKTVVEKLRHVGIYIIIVVRIVLKGIQLIGQAVFQRLSGIDIRLVGVERAVGVRGVHVPARAALLRDDVDDAAQGVGPEAYGHHALVHLDALGQVDGNVVQPEGAAHALLRHAVDKYLDVFARKAVEHELRVRARAARLADFQAGHLPDGLAQALGGVVQRAGVERRHVVGRLLHAADAGVRHHYLAQLFVGRTQGDVVSCRIAQGYLFFKCLVAQRRDHQGVGAFRRFQAELAPVVGLCAEGGALQINYRIIYGLALRGCHTARKQALGSSCQRGAACRKEQQGEE